MSYSPPMVPGDGAVAAAAGAVLFGLGLREAVRLRGADLELARSRARQLGAARIVAGLVLLARPQLLMAALGLSAAGEAGWWLSRMLAVREIAVGTGTVAASRPSTDPWLLVVPRPVTAWVQTNSEGPTGFGVSAAKPPYGASLGRQSIANKHHAIADAPFYRRHQTHCSRPV